MAQDLVNHPSHYTAAKDLFGFEVIDETEQRSFNIGSCLKYCFRQGKKAGVDPRQDVAKALWYAKRELSRMGSVPDPNRTQVLASRFLDRLEDPHGDSVVIETSEYLALKFIRDSREDFTAALDSLAISLEVLDQEMAKTLPKGQETINQAKPQPNSDDHLDNFAENGPAEWSKSFMDSFGDRLNEVDLQMVLHHWFQKIYDQAVVDCTCRRELAK